jgi:hypothetical protein
MKLLAIAMTLLFISPIAIQSQELLYNGRLFYMRGAIGYGFQSLKEVNDDIKNDELLLRSSGIPVNWDTFKGTYDVSMEMGFRLIRVLSVGISIGYQKNKINNSYSDYSGSLSENIAISAWDIAGNITLWIPGTKGLFVGANSGVGLGSIAEFISFQIYGDPTNSFTDDISADGKGFIAGMFAGYEAQFKSGPILFLKLGYRFRNLGEFEGTARSPELGFYEGKVLNNAGVPIEFDLSGFYVVGGFGIALGKII